jgi:Cu/Ag efflux pump CusA
MAIAIMGGLTVATVLTIFFVPSLYAAWFKVKRAASEDTAAHAVLPSAPAPAAAQ